MNFYVTRNNAHAATGRGEPAPSLPVSVISPLKHNGGAGGNHGLGSGAHNFVGGNAPPQFSVMDLFSGIGGFSLGLQRTGGFRTTSFCEIDPYCRRVLAKHWPDVPCHQDITKREYQEGEADVITAGFPCQDISTAGRGAGLAGARSGLWREVVRAVRLVRPVYVLLENVSALLGRGMGRVLGDLAASGYDTEWDCIPASAVGAPHRRDRVWIVAYPDYKGWDGVQVPSCAGSRTDAPTWASGSEQSSGSGGCPGGLAPVANPAGKRCGEARQLRLREPAKWTPCGHAAIPNADGARLAQWEGERSDARQKLTAIERSDWWLSEPDLGGSPDGISAELDEDSLAAAAPWERGIPRVATGVPDRVDRLRGLGNAVVPQIPELIGNAILNAAQQ